jgi:hypothetical protein
MALEADPPSKNSMFPPLMLAKLKGLVKEVDLSTGGAFFPVLEYSTAREIASRVRRGSRTCQLSTRDRTSHHAPCAVINIFAILYFCTKCRKRRNPLGNVPVLH